MSFVLVAHLEAKEGAEHEVAATMSELAEATRREPGCELYIPVQSSENPRSFLFYEQYVDEAAFEAHGASEHFNRLVVGKLASLLAEPRKRSFYKTL